MIGGQMARTEQARHAPASHRLPLAPIAALLVLVHSVAGCTTRVQDERTYAGAPLPRPDLIVVHDFAVAPDEVGLRYGLVARIEESFDTEPRSEQERDVGRQVANALAESLVAEIRDLGLPAERAGTATASGQVVAIEGQFVSIDEGDRARRMVIGFGAGESKVVANVQVFDETPPSPQLLDEFQVDATSGHKPGMGPMAGAGAAVAGVTTAIATSAGLSVASEAISDSVVADADRAARGIAKQLAVLFAQEGWIAR
jgi:Domain of unknown function (DUF4410)